MKNAIKKQEAEAPVETETTAIISMIERAARDPSVDVAKMRQLVEMRSQFEDKVAKRAFDNAMSVAQGEMSAIVADSINPQTKSRYASYFTLDKALRPIYTKSGFSLSFGTGETTEENSVRVTCHVAHSDGHGRNYHIDMPADGKGAKGGDVMTKTHAVGSALTYGQRYLLKLIFNIAIGGDDDGNAAGANPITDEQATQIRDLLTKTKADLGRFLKYVGAESITDIPSSKFKDAMTLLQKKANAS